jgi:hypothetical protein
MIQCSYHYQITRFLFAINRQEGEREKVLQFSLVKEKERNLLVNEKAKKNNISLSKSFIIH